MSNQEQRTYYICAFVYTAKLISSIASIHYSSIFVELNLKSGFIILSNNSDEKN